MLDPLQADAFNATGGRYDLSCQDILSSWYMTVVPCRVSGLCTRVCDPGGAERSHRCCVIPTFGKILIFPDLTWVSDVGYDSPWFAMRRRGFKAVGFAFGHINRGLHFVWSFYSHFGELLPQPLRGA